MIAINMNNPKYCIKCRFLSTIQEDSNYMYWCIATYSITEIRTDVNNSKPSWCPLIKVKRFNTRCNKCNSKNITLLLGKNLSKYYICSDCGYNSNCKEK